MVQHQAGAATTVVRREKKSRDEGAAEPSRRSSVYDGFGDSATGAVGEGGEGEGARSSVYGGFGEEGEESGDHLSSFESPILRTTTTNRGTADFEGFGDTVGAMFDCFEGGGLAPGAAPPSRPHGPS